MNQMGARIRGAGESQIVIEGVSRLYPVEYVLEGDRICAGTYLAAAMATMGDVTVRGIRPENLREPMTFMRAMGAEVFTGEREIRLLMKKRPKGISIRTGPYPQFPTDLQSIFLAVSCVADGKSQITETVFEARFAAACMLRRFGARIRLEGMTAHVEGRYPLNPAGADAPDLRGGAALVVAALAAEGMSVIGSCGHIIRGYEDICRDLTCLGAEARWNHM